MRNTCYRDAKPRPAPTTRFFAREDWKHAVRLRGRRGAVCVCVCVGGVAFRAVSADGGATIRMQMHGFFIGGCEICCEISLVRATCAQRYARAGA